MGRCKWSNVSPAERKNINILEVGCGPGANVWFLGREGFNVSAIDGSSTAIKLLRQRLDSEKIGYDQLEVGDILKLPFESNKFDAVIDNECIYCNNLENSRKIIQEVKRVLKPGGLFYSRTFSTDQSIGEAEEMQVRKGILEFETVSDGPLKGKGFVRLSNEQSIKDLYGSIFDGRYTLDELMETREGRTHKVFEYVVVAEKPKA
jgi:ubiquinone/menaquinone biosynthesis C-methylase UbiE